MYFRWDVVRTWIFMIFMMFILLDILMEKIGKGHFNRLMEKIGKGHFNRKRTF